jgi:hypothetical protein
MVRVHNRESRTDKDFLREFLRSFSLAGSSTLEVVVSGQVELWGYELRTPFLVGRCVMRSDGRCHSLPRDLCVLGIEVIADVAAAETGGSDEC